MAHNRSVFRETFNFRIGTSPIYQLKNKTRDSLDFIQRLHLDTRLEAHSGCVNTICWNETGTHILSGSDDQHLSITDPFSKKIAATIHSGHRANIFSARFLPNTQDRRIISCSGDGVIYYTQADREETHGQNAFVCHFGTAYEVQTIPQDPNSFLSCGEDCTVRWFDLRIKTKCGKPDCKEDILINCRRAVTALAVNPISPWQLSVGCSDSSVRVFDRRMLGTRATGNYTGRGLTGMVSRFTTPLLESRSHRITSLAYSPCGDDVLVSYSSDYIYMFNLKEDGRAQKFEMNSVDGTTTVTSTGPEQPGDPKGNDSQRYPPIKRLRLRGDWSDTGPNARPERERAEQDRGSVNIMQRMSEMLTRLLEGAARQGGSEQEQGATAGEAAVLAEAAQLASENNQGIAGPRSDPRPDSTNQSANQPPSTEMLATDPVPPSTTATTSTTNSSHQADPSVITNSSNMQEPNMQTSSSSVSNNDQAPSHPEGAESAPTQALTAVQAISQTIQEEKIEPVISLQYRSEGTSASTIRVELANVTVPSDSLTGVSSNPITSMTSGSLVAVSQSNPLPSETFTAVPTSFPVPPVLESDDSLLASAGEPSNLDFNDSREESQADFFESQTEFYESHFSDSPMEQPDSQNDGESKDSAENNSETKDSETVHPALIDEESKMSEGDVQDTPNINPSGGSESVLGEPSISLVTVEGATDSQSSVTESTERMTLHLTPQISVEEYISPDREDPPSDTTAENQDPAPTGAGNEENSPSEASSLPGATSPVRSRSVPRAGSSGVGASVRQRRFGHSGPPTGDFQLHSDDNDDEDDSDTELMRAHQNKYARPTRDENLAARRLQALYRKRQEEKEKEEWDSRCVHQPALKQIYKGHRNARTMIKEANFWSDKYVMSGSDCGHIFIWDRYSGQLVKLLEADKHVVNCIQPHPYFPILASSGIDYDIKIWTPSATDPSFDEKAADEIMNRNEVMLEETRDTITVPASFMLRMLASLNHVRASAAGRRGQGNSPDDDSTSSDDD